MAVLRLAHLRQISALPVVWEKPEYRAFAISLFFAGVANSTSMPLVTLFLTNSLHVRASQVSLFFITALAGPIVSIPIGRISDRLPSRVSLIYFSAFWLGIGWTVMAIARQVWLAFGVGVIFFCFIGILSAQIFAALRDVMTHKNEANEASVSSTVRTAYSLGWLVGPIVGGLLAGTVGVRFAFLTTAGAYLISTVPFRSLRIHVAVTSPHERPRVIGRENLRLLLFALIALFVSSGDAIKIAYLPLYIVSGLKGSVVAFGSLLSVSALAELIVLPVAGVVADRVGTHAVIVGGIAIGVAGYMLLTLSTQLWQLYLVQLLHVAVIAALMGLGITYAQQLSRHQPGLASSVYFGAQSLAIPLGSLMGSVGVRFLGLPHVFVIPAFICVFAVGGLLLLGTAPQEE